VLACDIQNVYINAATKERFGSMVVMRWDPTRVKWL
jgi:hypothetical protein